MAFLIKIGYIPQGKSTLEYVDIFGLQNLSHPLPSGIKKIGTSDLQTIVSLEVNNIREISLLPVNNHYDQETDYPTINCDKKLDQLSYDKLIYTPIQNFINLDNQIFESALSVSIWHLNQNTAKTLIKYSEVGVGKKIIFTGHPSPAILSSENA